MRRTWVRLLAVGGTALLVVWVASLFLPGLQELSWAAGTSSFVLAAVAMALAWTPSKRASTSLAQTPAPAPAGEQVDNRMGDNHGVSIQAGAIHGPVTVNTPPAQAGAPVPGWVEVALPVHQADARDLGVHEALPGPDGAGLPPYMARDVDTELDRRLQAAAASPRGGLVLVAGASTAGKTRTLAAALARTLPDRMLVAPPEDTDLRSLPAWLQERTKRNPQGWVVWLDDLDRHLSSSGLTPALVAELGRTGALVAATIRRERLDSLRPSATDPAPGSEKAGYAVLKTSPVVVNRRWSLPERERARASANERLVQAAADERFGVAEQLAAGPLLQQAWRDGPDSGHPRGYALVAAAVGLAQAGVSSSLTREQLHTAHSAYLPDPPPLPEETDRAWEWATQPRSGLAGLLVPADHDGLRWRAFDYLTLPRPLPEAVWQSALEAATDQDRLDVGLTAYHADRADIAESTWLRVAQEGNSLAMFNLGHLLERRGETDEAEHWYRRAAQQ
ncbi:sel1 repeat family protein, partial [Nocardiopsis sp. JB363]|uniref:sel1 repeat family protein n=1 Tax=Nocardiopsis sp. JB363 TaxID=1434837 RepID=UPI001F2CC4EC